MSRTVRVSGPITRNCTGKPTGGPKLKRSTRTRASVKAPSSTAFSIRALIRSRASTFLATTTISAKAEPEPRRALADIGGIGRDVLVVLQQRFRFFYRLLGDADRGALRQAQL